MFDYFEIFLLIFILSNFKSLNYVFHSYQNCFHDEKECVEIINNNEVGLWSKDKSKQLNIEEIMSIGGFEQDTNYIFGLVKDVAIDNEGNCFVNDYIDKCIKVYNKNGKFLRRIGRKGQGPGEFLNNEYIEIDKTGQLFVLDFLSNRRISKFDLKGKYLDSYKLPYKTGFFEMKLNSKNEIIMAFVPVITREIEYNEVIYHYNNNFEFVRSYGRSLFLYEHQYGKTYSHPHIDISPKDDIYCAFSYPYLIRIYRNGTLSKLVTRNCSEFTIFSWIFQEGLPIKQPVTRSRIQKIFCLPDSKFIVIIRDFGKNYLKKFKSTRAYQSINGIVTIIDLYDEKGNFLKSYPYDIGKYGSIIHIDSNGYFYTNSKDGVPMLTKYKFNFE